MIYLDSSALLKIFVDEPESDTLGRWLLTRAHMPMVTSELARLEVLRACRRHYPDVLLKAQAYLGFLDLVGLDTAILDDALGIGPAELRSLDSVHLASATAIREELTAFVCYDRRLCQAATAEGLEAVSPGRPG